MNTHLALLGRQGVSTDVVLHQRVQQCLRLLQVSGVESLGEPAVDLGQEPARFKALALLLPEATEAHGGAQLQGFRPLAAGHVQSPLQPGFRLFLRCLRLSQEHDAPQAIDFCFPPAFLMLLHVGVGLGQRLEAVCRVAQDGHRRPPAQYKSMGHSALTQWPARR